MRILPLAALLTLTLTACPQPREAFGLSLPVGTTLRYQLDARSSVTGLSIQATDASGAPLEPIEARLLEGNLRASLERQNRSRSTWTLVQSVKRQDDTGSELALEVQQEGLTLLRGSAVLGPQGKLTVGPLSRIGSASLASDAALSELAYSVRAALLQSHSGLYGVPLEQARARTETLELTRPTPGLDPAQVAQTVDLRTTYQGENPQMSEQLRFEQRFTLAPQTQTRPTARSGDRLEFRSETSSGTGRVEVGPDGRILGYSATQTTPLELRVGRVGKFRLSARMTVTEELRQVLENVKTP